MVRTEPRLLATIISAAVLLQLSSPAIAAWSPLQKSAQEEVEKSTDAKPVVQSIMEDQARQADAEAGNPEGSSASSPRGALDKFDEEVSKPEPRSVQGTSSTEVSEIPGEDEKEKAENVPGRKATETVNDPEFFYKRAQMYLRNKDLQSALNYINKALELNPDYWAAWYQKAMIYQLSGHDAAAARRYLELAKRRPDMLEVHIALGMLYRKHQNYEQAEDEYKLAIELNAKNFAAHYNYANVLLEQQKLEDALKEYKVCLKLHPTNAMVHNNVGVIYEKRSFLEEAAEEYTRASHLDPANQKFAQNLTEVKHKLANKPGKTM